MIPVYVLLALVYPTLQTDISQASNITDLVSWWDQRNCRPIIQKVRCICVPHHQCKDDQNGDIPKIDIRTESYNMCDSYLEICCVNVTKTVPTTARIKVRKQGCGHRQVYGVSFRITGGDDNEAQFGEFPWMVGLVNDTASRVTNDSRIFTCGGALIHPKVVLTAAHCIKHNNPSKVRVGEWDTSSTNNEMFPYQERNIQNVTIYPKFIRKILLNDIALLHLDSPVELDDHIGTICLPPSNISLSSPLCAVSGWGKNIHGPNGQYQNILKSIDLPLISNAVCQDRLRNTTLGKGFRLHSSFICAGGEGDDSCTGDGGGPLICPVPGNMDDRYYQVGIVSGGVGCGLKNVPGLYTNLSKYRSWIDNEMKKVGLDNSSYTY